MQFRKITPWHVAYFIWPEVQLGCVGGAFGNAHTAAYIPLFMKRNGRKLNV